MLILPGQEESWESGPGGLWVPAQPKRPVAVDLFAGCGGFSLGMIDAGFQVIAALEWDADAAITYLINLGSYPLQMHFASPEDQERLEKRLQKYWKKTDLCREVPVSGSHRPQGRPGVDHFFFGDARKFTGAQILQAIGMRRGELDCVVGGPPCQGFSRAGTRNVLDPRNSLVFDFARLIIEMQPKTMVMENVPEIVDMVTPEGLPVIDAFSCILEDGGMGTFEGIRKVLAGNPGSTALIRPEHARQPLKRPKYRTSGRKKNLSTQLPMEF
ncbi:MAG: DNA cytosine methyltransferase [Desulfobulbaceae bacterium]